MFEDQVKEIIQKIEPIDLTFVEKAKSRTAQLAIPPRALGRLHDISEKICGMTRTLFPLVSKKAILVMAGDHGIVKEGVSAFPQAVTGEMIKAFLVGGAGINAISRYVGADVWVVDAGAIPEIDPGVKGSDKLIVRKVAKGTANFAKGPAMSLEQAAQSLMVGFSIADDLFKKGLDIIGTGDMGIGNTTPSAAIGAVVTGKSLDIMVGPGTGIDSKGMLNKQRVIQQGIDLNKPDPQDGLDILSKVGGFEIGAIAGTILAAAYNKKPVVIDGFISTAGALIANQLSPYIKDYMFAGHCSEEPGHKSMLEYLGLKPILDLGMRLGEGTGGALSMGVIEGSIKVFREVLTFEEAGVSKE